MAPHSSTFAWKIPWVEEPGGLQSMGSWRVRQDWANSLSLFTFMNWRRKWQPQCSCLENPRDRGTWWAAVYGVPQSRTQLNRLSSLVIGNPDFSLSSFPPHLFIIVFGRHFVIPSVFFFNYFPGIRPLNPLLQSYHFIPCMLLALLQSQLLLFIIKIGTWIHLTQMGQACQEPIFWETDWKAQETKDSTRNWRLT